MGKTHKFFDVIESLRKKTDCIVSSNSIKVNMGITRRGAKQKKDDLGIKSWGKIDYLVNHMGFHLEMLPEF